MNSQIGYKAKAFEGRNLLFFFLIAFGWTWIWWWILFLSGWVEVPADLGTHAADVGPVSPFIILLVAISPFGPTIAGFIMTAVNEGRSGVKALWKRFWNLKIRWTWLLVIILWWPLLRLITNLVGQILTGDSNPILAYPDQIWIFIPPLIISTFVNGGMSEEFGWRGYALPRLQARFNALISSVILGIIEGLWHYPLIIIGTWWQGNDVLMLVYWFIVTDIFRTWIFNNTNGNILATMLFHGMGNTQSDIIWCCSALSHFYWVYGMAALLVVIVYGPRTLTRTNKQDALNEEQLEPV